MRSLAFLLLVALAAPLRAQEEAPAVADSGSSACFGVSFGAGCRIMFQYEVGVRRGSGHMPRSRVLPYAGADPDAYGRTDVDLFVGGGLMFARGPKSALGVVADFGSDFASQSVGVRYARQVARSERVELTGGLVTFRAAVVSDPVTTRHAVGAYGEAAFHENNWLTATVRGDVFPPEGPLTGGHRIQAGFRLERRPALAASAVAALLATLIIVSFSGAEF